MPSLSARADVAQLVEQRFRKPAFLLTATRRCQHVADNQVVSGLADFSADWCNRWMGDLHQDPSPCKRSGNDGVYGETDRVGKL